MPTTNGHGSGGATERVALYLRVSSEEQRDRETIEIQREFLEQYRNLYELEVADIYKDDGISGTIPLHERAEGRQLLDDAKAGKFDAVLVYKLDRLGRSLLVIVDAHDRLQTAGLSLRSATEPIDTSNPSGRLIFQMLASFAEYERETIRERTQAGLHRALRNGKQLGMIPYGYDIAPDGSFVIVEDEARIVAEIIANIAAGAALYSEAERLNDEGVPSPGRKYRGKPRKYGSMWRASTVQGIVKRGAYSGTHTVNAHKEPIERKVPAIVEPGLQQKALAHMAENRRFSGGRPHREYLLRGLVRCEQCGALYSGGASTSNGYRYHYYSSQRNRATREKRLKTNHSCVRVRADWLEELVWSDVRSFLKNPGEVLERVRVELAEDAESEDLEERHASLARRLAAKQTEKGRYVKLYAQGHLDEKELDVHLVDLKNQVENLKLLIASVEADIGRKEENKLTAQTTEAWLLTLRERVEEVEEDTGEALEKRRKLVKLLVEQIKVDRNEDGHTQVQITYRFGSPPEEPGFVYGVQNSPLWYNARR
jgi:site-specific DNA recombinase